MNFGEKLKTAFSRQKFYNWFGICKFSSRSGRLKMFFKIGLQSEKKITYQLDILNHDNTYFLISWFKTCDSKQKTQETQKDK